MAQAGAEKTAGQHVVPAIELRLRNRDQMLVFAAVLRERAVIKERYGRLRGDYGPQFGAMPQALGAPRIEQQASQEIIWQRVSEDVVELVL